MTDAAEPAAAFAAEASSDAFRVSLDVFEGPFDLLLGLISKHQLDVTEVALSKVTDDFIAHIRAMGAAWDLGQATEFLVVAATLLDLKAARLLPAGEVEDEEDLALLEARDLLFARLLQYRAYKEAAGVFAGRMAAQGRRFARRVPMEPQFAGLLPEVLLGLGPAEFARIAAVVLAPRPPSTSTCPGPASPSRPRSWPRGCAGCTAPRSGSWSPTAPAPTRWWPGSSRCSSSTGRVTSSLSRQSRWGIST
jgi:segregation and condensation protein A